MTLIHARGCIISLIIILLTSFKVTSDIDWTPQYVFRLGIVLPFGGYILFDLFMSWKIYRCTTRASKWKGKLQCKHCGCNEFAFKWDFDWVNWAVCKGCEFELREPHFEKFLTPPPKCIVCTEGNMETLDGDTEILTCSYCGTIDINIKPELRHGNIRKEDNIPRRLCGSSRITEEY